ncbi:MAG: NTP transferase domain-containing protein [Candidatus Buchananbacteria bacterium]
MDKVKILILAGGLGKRMNNLQLPKVLVELNGKPLIKHLLEAIKVSGVDSRPSIVVGKKAELVKATLGDEYDYVFQAEQLGTGHAVMCAEEALAGRAENILVLYGDMPLLLPQTIKNFAASHLASGKELTMGTVLVDEFSDWRTGFYDFGRIIRNSADAVCGIVEKKDATPEQLAIKEVNPGYFCFKAAWLWGSLKKLKNENNQREYYLTDLVQIACEQGIEINTVLISPKEAVGINNEDQLKVAEKLMG